MQPQWYVLKKPPTQKKWQPPLIEALGLNIYVQKIQILPQIVCVSVLKHKGFVKQGLHMQLCY